MIGGRWTRGAAMAAALLLASVSMAAAQASGRVSGQLTDSASLKPVKAAIVTIEELRKDVKAGADGTFAIDNVPAGTYHLVIVSTGYVPRAARDHGRVDRAQGGCSARS